MKLTEQDYLVTIHEAELNPNVEKILENLVAEHFAMLRHMKETPLYDIFEYEKRLVEPMKILAYDNENLKKEVNKLRKQLGKIEKYKEVSNGHNRESL